MKTTRWIGFLVITFLFTLIPAFAADAVTGGTATATNTDTLLLAIIPVLVPLLVALGKWAVPKVPTWILPILAPALGAAVDFLTTWATGAAASPALGAILGSAGVGVRELVDQVKGRLAGGPAAKLPLLLLCASLPVVALTPGCALFKEKPTAEAVIYYTFKDSWTLSKTAYDSWSERVVQGKVSQAQSDEVDAKWNQFRASFKAAIALARNDYTAPTPASLLAIQTDLLLLITTFSK